jgi:hypothetical protein
MVISILLTFAGSQLISPAFASPTVPCDVKHLNKIVAGSECIKNGKNFRWVLVQKKAVRGIKSNSSVQTENVPAEQPSPSPSPSTSIDSSELAKLNGYINCLHTLGLTNINNLSDVQNLDIQGDSIKAKIAPCAQYRPSIANAPVQYFDIPNSVSTTPKLKMQFSEKNNHLTGDSIISCSQDSSLQIKWIISPSPNTPEGTTFMPPRINIPYQNPRDADIITAGGDKRMADGTFLPAYVSCVVSDSQGTFIGIASAPLQPFFDPIFGK